MFERSRQLTRTHWVLVGVGFLGLFMLIIIPAAGETGSWWGDVLITVSQAAVVTGVLGLTIEPLARQASIDRAMEDAASYVLTLDLPSEASDAINYISERKLIRCDFTIQYEFSDHSDDGKIRVRPKISYGMQNFTQVDQTFPFDLRLRGSSARHGEIDLIWARGDDLGGQTRKRTSLGNRVNIQEDYTIPPNRERVENQFVVWGTQVLPESHEDVFFFNEPTLGATVLVDVEGPLELDVDVTIGTLYEERVVNPEDDEFPMEWGLGRTLLLPGQAISVQWEPSEQKQAQLEDPTEPVAKATNADGRAVSE